MELTQTGMKFVRDSTPLLSEYNLFISKLKNYSEEAYYAPLFPIRL